jgi:signal transduction histidine kinase/ABC-type amino acid transport substrate-binding protein/ActR/RegA family two-component response regulator
MRKKGREKIRHRHGAGICAVLLVLLLCISGGISVSAAGSSAARKTIRVGYFPFDGYQMVDADGTRSGYGYDYLQAMLPYMDFSYSYAGYAENKSWSDMLDMLDRGEIDLLTSASKTDEREEKFDYSDEPIGTSSAILTVRAGDTRYQSGNIAGWDGMHVGLLYNNSRNASFADFARQNGFRYETKYFESVHELTEALADGSIDAIVTSNLRQVRNEWVLAQFDPKPFYIIVKKGNADLLADVNYAISQINTVTPDLQEELFRKYYSPENGSEIAFTEKEQKFIDSAVSEDQVFTAIINPDEKPYSWFENGQAKGILSDLCQEVFRRTGLQFRILETKDRAEYLSMKKNGTADVCCVFCSNAAHAENDGYVLTQPYYTASIARIYRNSFSGNPRTAAVVNGEEIQEELPDLLDGLKTFSCSSVQGCVSAVKSGAADTCYLLTNTAQAAVYDDQTNQLVCVSLPSRQIRFSLAVNSRADYLLASVLEKAANSLSDQNIADISAPYTVNIYRRQTIIGMLYDHPFMIALLVSILFILMIAVLEIGFQHRKQAAEERSNAALRKAVDDAEKANRAKTEFISRISHDIRTPIGIIRNMTNFAMEDAENPEKLRDDLKKIDSADTFLLSLINDVLDISKIDSGMIELRPEPYLYDDYISNIRNMFQPFCEQKGLTLHIEEKGANACILIDHTRLNQITLNLISNAVKYTPAGGTITFCAGSLEREDGRLDCRIEVTDTGIGMSEEFQSRMFQPFTQEYDNPQHIGGNTGTGLGLSIVKRIVDLLGGTITVKSELGKGTAVTVCFTAPKAAVYGAAPAPVLQEEKQPGPVLQGHVLLAEDNEINAEIAARLLESIGITLDIAENGRRALELFRESAPGCYKAILMDLQMPLMDGFEATERIRALDRPDARKIPIIAMTADAFSAAMERCRQAGMDDYITKPVDPEQLKAVLQKVWNN